MSRLRALAKIERRQAQMQTMFEALTTFLRTNPFFNTWKFQYQTHAVTIYPRPSQGFRSSFTVKKGATTVEKHDNIKNRSRSISPSDSDLVISTLLQCGYINGHNAMKASHA